MALEHEFAWSVSRHTGFAECRRRHYLDYYLSWLGWDRNAEPERRRAYLLKKMTRMAILAGTCLHDALEDWFAERRRGGSIAPKELADRAVDALRTGYKQSRDGEWRQRPGKLTRLAEHHYEEEDIDEPSGRAGAYGKRFVERIQGGLAWFFEAPELARVRDAPPDRWLACEEMGTIELFRTKVYAVPDFAFRDGDGVWIYDWKSGSPRPADAFQLALYVLYAEQKCGIDPGEVTCVDAYLPRRELVESRFTADDLEEVLGEVHGSITQMRELYFDAAKSVGDAERFPKIEADAPEARACARCNYRELCDR